MKTVTSALILFLGSACLAQSAAAPIDDPLISLKDSSISVRDRDQHSNTGDRLVGQAQYDLELNLQLRLDESGKWHVVSRLKTGPTFNTGFNNAGIGNDTKLDSTIAPRELFLKYESDGNVASVGALTTLPSPEAKGVFSYDEDGWIDGARLEKTGLSTWAKRVSITVGRIDQINTPSFIDRGVGAPNVIQVHVIGNINSRIGYVLEGTRMQPSGQPSAEYLRAVIQIATKDILKFVDTVSVEQLFQNSSVPVQGFALSAKTIIATDWSLTEQFSHRGHDVSAADSVYGPREDFYREGDQISLFVTKTIKAQHPIEISFGVGKTIAGPVSGEKSPLGLGNDRGLRVDTKIKVKF